MARSKAQAAALLLPPIGGNSKYRHLCFTSVLFQMYWRSFATCLPTMENSVTRLGDVQPLVKMRDDPLI